MASPAGAPRRALFLKGPRPALALVAVHAALAIAVGLGGALVFSLALTPSPQPLWIAVDLALVAAAAALIVRLRAALGFACLGEHRLARLAGLAALSIACVLAVWALIPDRNGVWLDEAHYLETVRRGELIRDGVLPFSARWLAPFLAGRWNLLPVDDALALKAVIFGSFAVTAFFLALLLVRLRVPLGLAALSPIFLLSSYLGVYGAGNRLVLDAFNYATFVILLHALVRPEHARLFAALLLFACLNSEKALFFWAPLYAAVALLRLPCPWPHRPAKVLASIALDTLRVAAPALVYTLALALYLTPARTELLTCVDNLHRLAFTANGLSLRGSCAEATTFQMLWLPFGPFSLYALLAFPSCPRWLRALPLLLVPIFLQVLAATDTERMVAYAFLVFLPLGFVYLSRALGSLPDGLRRAFLVALPLVAAAQHFLVPLARALHLALPTGKLRMALAAAEVLLVGALLYLHHVVYAARAGYDRS
jgi:hypothetical protein